MDKQQLKSYITDKLTELSLQKKKQKQSRNTTKLNNEYVEQITNTINSYRQETNRSELSKNSMNMILNHYKKLIDYMKPKDSQLPINFLHSVKSVIDSLVEKQTQPNTIRNYLNSIIYILQSFKIDKSIITDYEIVRDLLNDEYNKTKNELSTKQKENIPTEDEMKKLLRHTKRDSHKLLKLKRSDMSEKDIQQLQFYILINLYQSYNLRNDFYDMKTINKVKYKKLSQEQKNTNNFLVVDRTNMYFSIGRDKTSKSNNHSYFEIDNKSVRLLLNKYMKVIDYQKDMKPLFIYKNKDMTSNNLTLLLQHFTKHYINKSISSTILRKYLYMNMSDKSIENYEKVSSQNQHSLQTAYNIYDSKTK